MKRERNFIIMIFSVSGILLIFLTFINWRVALATLLGNGIGILIIIILAKINKLI